MWQLIYLNNANRQKTFVDCQMFSNLRNNSNEILDLETAIKKKKQNQNIKKI